ncbi:hypothetical protein GCM10011507_20460 [Edaphobacter acidisoli]|uniref:Uncharacterized protein n=1 Tax=Edaphobacter acidisoli TaxID=2040573 RepID=A0A916W575_9BACT|nr:hypothetical protein GCM10011507_20460 [Edaphobacter acidisoli]
MAIEKTFAEVFMTLTNVSLVGAGWVEKTSNSKSEMRGSLHCAARYYRAAPVEMT